MTRYCVLAFAAASLGLLGFTPALAQRPGLQPGGQPAPTSFSAADELWKDTSTSLSRIIGQPCLDQSAVNTIALAEKAIAQLASFRFRQPVSGFMSDAEYAPIRSLDLKIGQLRGMLSEIKDKKPCPPPASAAPASTPATTPTPATPTPSTTTVVPADPQRCPTQTNQAVIDALTAQLQTLFERIKKTQLGLKGHSQGDLESRINQIEQTELPLQEFNIKQVSEDPGRYTPEDQHPATWLEELKKAKKQNEEDLKTLRKMLQLRIKLDDLISYRPCPETGMYVSLEFVKNVGRVRTTETSVTDFVTNQFSDSGDPLGVGIVVGYNFLPWNNRLMVGPFASFDWLHQTINHTFPGGTFLGTTTHWIATTGAKLGTGIAPSAVVYGLAGASWLNHDLNVNFATAASRNTTTPGFTLGVGGEFRPSMLQGFGMPVAVFAQYQHTWWNDAHFNTPASSPAFNYTFRREDDTIKLGLNFYFGAPPPAAPAPRSYPVKAPPK